MNRKWINVSIAARSFGINEWEDSLKKSVIAAISVFLISLAACGGSVTLPSDTTSSGNGGASSSSSDDTTSSSSVGTGGAGGWSNQGGGGQGGTGGQEPTTLLLVTDDGANDPEVRTCEINATGLAYTLAPQQNHSVTIHKQHIRIESTDGGLIRGSAGTPYFRSIRLMNGGFVYRGPMEIGPIPLSATTTTIDFIDAFDLIAEKHLTVVFDSYCAEDTPGEFVGHHYRIVWQPMTDGDAFDLTDNLPLDPASIKPNTEIIGGEFVITTPS